VQRGDERWSMAYERSKDGVLEHSAETSKTAGEVVPREGSRRAGRGAH
jgi:hypothetical protein